MDIQPILVKFIKFGVVGASGFVLHFGVLYLLRDVIELNQYVANVVGFVVAATSNYFLNRIWTFRSQEQQVAREYLKFFLVSVVGLGINTGTLWLLTHLIPAWSGEGDWRFYILWLVAVGITTLWNFFGNMIFTFKHAK